MIPTQGASEDQIAAAEFAETNLVFCPCVPSDDWASIARWDVSCGDRDQIASIWYRTAVVSIELF